ncbi:hypothetical protein BDK51DRAFT_47853 [Blyttiomyces helicus]|uniref:Ankyrin repeat-containing domain protein n=1 Tax=Blyttiomyces helicus TaxID=388810 RepID=A0A4P9WCQ1_9FUNG|nr:hypothetical protein BDK51DRAFT_47853 [Blyttiomyces helicus]|eukprot:RKO90449.1 hypothetical protein BDK51DRAFT_47853 [Blyttiomyces helicus]
MDGAASCSLEVVRFLHELRTEGCTVHAVDDVIERGKIEIVCYLLEARNEGCSPAGFDSACESWAWFDFVENGPIGWGNYHEQTGTSASSHWLRSFWLFARPSEEAATDAERRGKIEEIIERLKGIIFLLFRHYPAGGTEHALTCACQYQCLELLRFLLDTRPELYSPNALKVAFDSSHAEILRILYESGKRFTDEDVKRILHPAYSQNPASDSIFDIEIEPDRRGAEAFVGEIHGMLLVRDTFFG